jgi:hypothetical protein
MKRDWIYEACLVFVGVMIGLSLPTVVPVP